LCAFAKDLLDPFDSCIAIPPLSSSRSKVKNPAGNGERHAGGGRDTYEGFLKPPSYKQLTALDAIGCDLRHNLWRAGSKTRNSSRYDGDFLEKRFFVMADTRWRGICDGRHCGTDWHTYISQQQDRNIPD